MDSSHQKFIDQSNAIVCFLRTLVIKVTYCGEPAISLHSHHVSLVQWTTCLLPVTRDPGSNPLGGLLWNRDSPVSVVSLHWWPCRDWSSLQPCLHRASSQKLSLGCRADNVISSLDLTQLFCPGFTLAAGPPSSFTSDKVGCWGGALWRACNLTSFSPCLTGPVDYLFASCHKGPRFKSPGGGLM
jgi:hypothetical protein